MRNVFTKKQVGMAAACALALGFLSGTASAQSRAPVNERALVKNAETQVWMNGFGECWHSSYGPAPSPNVVCGPQPVAQFVAPAPVAPAPVAPAPVAPAPAPYVAPVAKAPIVIAAAAPQPVYEKVTLDADALFDFDKAVLRPAGRSTLDEFVGKLKVINPSTITAIGYTDRLGSNGYNKTLSEKRAAAVKTYLVSQGIMAGSVQATGMGETNPVTKAGDCMGGKSAKLIACLQPDRRVEVEGTGSMIKQ